MSMNTNLDVPIVILCGGQGTRLREETEYKPKPMVTIGGKPILWHIMKIYSYYGFNNFILALGYKGDMIRNYFLNYQYYNNDFQLQLGSNEKQIFHTNGVDERNWKITFVDTGENSMTGARIKRCGKYINTDDFGVTYGDGVGNVDLIKEFNFHLKHEKLVTMLGVNPESKFGELTLEGNQVVSFKEKPKGIGIINGGFFFMKKNFLNYLDIANPCVLEGSPLEKAASENQLHVFEHKGYWQCMDTYRDYLYFNNEWDANRRPWALWQKE